MRIKEALQMNLKRSLGSKPHLALAQLRPPQATHRVKALVKSSMFTRFATSVGVMIDTKGVGKHLNAKEPAKMHFGMMEPVPALVECLVSVLIGLARHSLVLCQMDKLFCSNFVKGGIFQQVMWHWYRSPLSMDEWVQYGKEYCKLMAS
ncbi:hypothetical protein HPP92_023982 [Vanilla planifolia]|uniref:Uncharacterized protein n=1 Tax=Vanilla planifolia TaxID=51239 RepID=A0A835UB45_VANPL|nr:hypothetical protein HPP92_023982 [Vanilla planifolia]